MNTQNYWEQLQLPFDIGPSMSTWQCPNCAKNTVLVVKFEDKEIFIHARSMCVKHMGAE